MASPFKQEQRGKVKFEGQRKKLPGLFPGWPPSDLWWHFVVWVIWHAHSCMGISSCKGVWEMLPQPKGFANKEGKNGY